MFSQFKHKLLFILLSLSIPIFFVLDIAIGVVAIPLDQIWAALFEQSINEPHEIIIWQSRIPKAITAILVGASLSISGLLMQTLFRNPLAGPYILGVSSGAGLGVAILVMGAGLLGFQIAGIFSITLSAMLGAVGILFLLFLISLYLKDVMTLLIVGIMIGSVATAFIGLLQYFTSDAQLKSFLIWTLGSLEGLNYHELGSLALILISSYAISLLLNKSLNALLLGENYAKSLGVHVVQTRLVIILITGLLAGAVTALCGPIGFVGIIIPHLCRLAFKSSNHKLLIPASALMGASTLLLSDLLANLPAAGISLPINSITAIIGIPIILWILLGKNSISSSF